MTFRSSAPLALIMTAVHVALSDDVALATDYPFLASVWVVGSCSVATSL